MLLEPQPSVQINYTPAVEIQLLVCWDCVDAVHYPGSTEPTLRREIKAHADFRSPVTTCPAGKGNSRY